MIFGKKKIYSSEKPYNTNYSGPKWGYRILVIFGLYAVINLVSQFTLKSHYSAYLITLVTGLFLVLFVLLVLIRLTKNMFKARHRQYGFFLILFLYFSLYGMTTFNKWQKQAEINLQSDYYQEMMDSKVNQYFNENPTIDTLEYAVAESIGLSLIDNSPELYSQAMMLWEYKIMWQSGVWGLIVFFACYVVYRIKFQIDIFRLRRHKDIEITPRDLSGT